MKMHFYTLFFAWSCFLSHGLFAQADLQQDGQALVQNVDPSPKVSENSNVDVPPNAEPVLVKPLIDRPEKINGEVKAVPFAPLEKQQAEAGPGGFIIKDAALNEILQYLAKTAGKQYFHNSKINGPEFLVTGHLTEGSPLRQMEELAFMFGLSLHTKGSTIYALTQSQLSQLPSSEFHYQLRYLRPTDMDQIKELIKPMLTPGTGIVNFEPKTNTIIIIDSTHRIEQARKLLHGVDQPKGQIIVETKILRVNSEAAERVGVNWSKTLGTDGTSLNLSADLNGIFGIRAAPAVTNTNSANLVLSPIQLSGVLRALAEGGIARQVSNPTLITEDNEQATISIIDRIPIITSTTTPGGAGSAPIVSEEVRYKIDAMDKSIDGDPEKHREIGISLVVTPTVLPDGTVRMKMRPRSAQIVSEVTSITGNKYPRVTESMVEAIARVPDGHSLVVGGFYGESENRNRNKIPMLGDIPIVNFFFKSKESYKEQASLVFVVTPRSYNPARSGESEFESSRLHRAVAIGPEHDWVDPTNAGPAHDPNLWRSLRGLIPRQAPTHPNPTRANASDAIQVKSSSPRFSKASQR
jgi:type II secretory pathway component GspD/PulD (secretin)